MERTVFFSTKTVRELRRWLQFKDRYCESPFMFPVRHTGRMLKDSNHETNFAKYIKRAVGALVISQEIRVQFIYVFPVLQ